MSGNGNGKSGASSHNFSPLHRSFVPRYSSWRTASLLTIPAYDRDSLLTVVFAYSGRLLLQFKSFLTSEVFLRVCVCVCVCVCVRARVSEHLNAL